MSFLGSVFSSSKAPQVQYAQPGFKAGGLKAEYQPGSNDVSVEVDPTRAAAVSGVSDLLNQQGHILSGLRQTVGPGFNDLLKARLAQINNSATSAIGDLRQNLAARRVLGSSFGQDTLNRAESQFAQQRDAITADNFLKSLSANQDLLQQEYAAKTGAFQNALNEMNLEANLANGLTNQAATQLGANARVNAQLDQSAQILDLTRAKGVGSLLGLGLAPFTGGLSFLPQGLNGLSTDIANNGSGIYTGPASIPGFG